MNTLLLSLFLLLAPGSHDGKLCLATTAEEFPPFLQTFSESKAFAMERTILPLKDVDWEYGVNERGEEETIAKRSETSAAQYKASPTLNAYMQENGMVSEIKSITGNLAVVEVFKPDTDWLLSYHFIRQGNCWHLEEIQDHSL